MARPVAMSTRAGTRLAGGGSVTPFRRSRHGRRRAACHPIIRTHEWTFRCLVVGRMPVGPNVGRGIGRDSPPRPSVWSEGRPPCGKVGRLRPVRAYGTRVGSAHSPGCCALGKAVGLRFGPVQAFLGPFFPLGGFIFSPVTIGSSDSDPLPLRTFFLSMWGPFGSFFQFGSTNQWIDPLHADGLRL